MKQKLQILPAFFAAVLMCSVICSSVTTAATITSTAAGGKWSAAGTWTGSVVPGASDDVIIANGATVTIDANVSVASLTVGQGTSGVLTFDLVAKRTVVVAGNVTVAAGGTFIAQSAITTTGDLGATSTTITNVASTTGVVVGMNIGTVTGIAAGATVTAFTANSITLSIASTNAAALPGAVLSMGYDDSLAIGGNLTNNGTFDLSRGNAAGVCNVTFTKAGDQTITGTGTTTRFRGITLSKSAVANKVIASINISAAGTPIAFVAGTWEQTAGRFTGTTGSIAIGSLTATACALNIIGTGGMQIASNLNVYGSLLVNTTDSLIVGAGSQKIDLTYVLGAAATFTKGTVMVYGKMATAALTMLTINGANIVIDPKGFAAVSGTDYSFRSTTGTGGVNAISFTSGTLSIKNPNSMMGSSPELAASASLAPNISGTATIILGQGAATVFAPAGFKINLNSATVLNHLVLNTGTDSVALQTNVKMNGNLTIKTCAGRSGAFFFTTPNYVFNGSAAQVTGNMLPDTVKNLTVNNAAGVTASKTLFISDTLFLVNGKLAGPYTARVTVNVATGVGEVNAGMPHEFSLNQNYPNPFNPSTIISYTAPNAGFISLRIYDVMGREVAALVNEEKQVGMYSVTWNAAGMSSGIYYCTMRAGAFTETRKMLLMK